MIRPVVPANNFVMGKHRIYMLPTRYGVIFAGLVFIILLASINYGNGMGYGLSFLLASAAFISMIYTHRNLSQVKVSCSQCQPVFAGEAAHFTVIATSEDSRNKIGIELQQNKEHLQDFNITAGESAQIVISCKTHTRGYISAPGFRLLTRFPFGLVYTWSRDILLKRKCLVYPRPADRYLFDNASELETGIPVQKRKQGLDFSGLREFSVGDSPRRIHWRASARSTTLLTKQYTDEGGSVVKLDWERTTGDIETRLSQLCRGILDAQQSGRQYALKIPGTDIPASSGETHQHRCLKALACFGAA